MVILVADKLKRQWFLLVLGKLPIKQPEPQSYLTTENPYNICEEVTIYNYSYRMLFDEDWCLSHGYIS